MKIAMQLLVIIVVGTSIRNADAKTITVHITADSGPGSLRQAIAQASNGDKVN